MEIARNLPYVILSLCVTVTYGCHTKVVVKDNGIRVRRSPEEIHPDLIQFFTSCMERGKFKDTFRKWESIVQFVVKDTQWYSENDHTYCNSTLGHHTTTCWIYNVDYLIRTTSFLNQATKDCITEYGNRTAFKKSERSKRGLLWRLSFQEYNAGFEDSVNNHFTDEQLVGYLDTFTESNEVPASDSTASCSPNQQYKQCLLQRSSKLPSDGGIARSFSMENKEDRFDEDVLNFITNHFSQCSATYEQRINRMQICDDGNATPRSLSAILRPQTCLSKVMKKIVRKDSPMMKTVNSCTDVNK